MGKRHSERHLGKRGGWLRAAVLGANDGLVSTASLMVGVASAGILSMGGADHVLVSGFAGLVAGAMSMAAGEYVSVSSQADGERADLARERYELAVSPQMELAELAGIYEARGLDPTLAQQVAEQLTRHDAMDAHARDELGLTEVMAARPLSAALASAGSFAVGSALPLLTAYLAAGSRVIPAIFAVSLLGLAGMGALAANAAGASPVRGAARVTFWGLLAMVLTAGVGCCSAPSPEVAESECHGRPDEHNYDNPSRGQRFDHGRRLLAQTYRAHVAAPDNVVAVPGARAH